MPVYQPLKHRERIFTWSVPSTKGAWIKGPGTPRWSITKAVEGVDGDVAWEDALLRSWICHEETSWNLQDKDKNDLPRTPETIEEILTPNDLNALAKELTKRLFPEAWAFYQKFYESAEGNVLATLMPSQEPSSTTTGSETPSETAP